MAEENHAWARIIEIEVAPWLAGRKLPLDKESRSRQDKLSKGGRD
jgi:hypothetical protein